MKRIAIALLAAVVIAGCATTAPYKGMEREYLGKIRFPARSADVERIDLTLLDELAATLQDERGSVAFITGHAYDFDSSAQNSGLGGRRAQAAADYLIAQGIEPERVRVKSRGDSDPPISRFNMVERDNNSKISLYIDRYK